MKTDVSPMYLTYFMMDWTKIGQGPSGEMCTECSKPMNVTEEVIDQKGTRYRGYVCHNDKRVLWVREG